MRLDEFVPDFDVAERHRATVQAPAPVVWSAVHELSWREVPIFRTLMGARAAARFDPDRPILEDMKRLGFMVLAEDAPHELVLGVIGRFWRPLERPRWLEDPAEFPNFHVSGYAKAAVNFALSEQGDSTLVTTETRVTATDDAARRSFARYWALIGPFSAWIRSAWLDAIRKRAERG